MDTENRIVEAWAKVWESLGKVNVRKRGAYVILSTIKIKSTPRSNFTNRNMHLHTHTLHIPNQKEVFVFINQNIHILGPSS